jgi:uncharacterized protein YqeY
MKDGDLRNNILEAMKDAMRSRDKERLGTIRMIQAAVKQWEVDERIVLTDEQILTVLDKMIRQRREAMKQFEAANRDDLVQKESQEIAIIQHFLPTPLTTDALETLIKHAIQEAEAQSVRDMSKVMAIIKPKVQGRADMGTVGSLIKNLLPQ